VDGNGPGLRGATDNFGMSVFYFWVSTDSAGVVAPYVGSGYRFPEMSRRYPRDISVGLPEHLNVGKTPASKSPHTNDRSHAIFYFCIR